MTDQKDVSSDLKQAALDYHRLEPKGKIRVTVQFLGSLSVQPSNTASVKQYVGTPLK